MKRAYLNCVAKTIEVEIAGENFKLKLEGQTVESGMVRTKQGNFITRFDFTHDTASFSVVKDNAVDDYLQKGDFNSLMTGKELFTVVVTNGSKADYVGITFPQGINSYLFAFGMLVREADSGSVGIYEKLQKIAFEWEEKTIGWDWEEVIYEEALVDFLHTHNFID